MLRNTEHGYGSAARLLHWSVALLIIGLFIMGLRMGDLPNGPDKMQMYGLHKSLGVLVIMLVAARLAWRAANPAPLAPSTTTAVQQALAQWAHRLLYILMIAVPVAGVLMSQTGGRPVSFFGLFELPTLMGKNEPLHEALEGAHAVMAFLMIAVVVIHAGAAIWHHFVLKDDVLRRMTSGRLGSQRVG